MTTKANLVINQGDTYSVTLNLTDDNGLPLSLSGFTANSAMKRWYTSNTAYVFNASINTTAGTITLEMDANVTVAIPSGRYVYDVELIDNSNTSSRIVEGLVFVSPGVTAANIG
jgi:hypothetical protein